MIIVIWYINTRIKSLYDENKIDKSYLSWKINTCFDFLKIHSTCWLYGSKNIIACTFRYTWLYYTFSIIVDRDSSKFHYFSFLQNTNHPKNKSAGNKFNTVHFSNIILYFCFHMVKYNSHSNDISICKNYQRICLDFLSHSSIVLFTNIWR